MVALNTQPHEKRVRITREEARILVTAVTISCIQSPPTDCVAPILDAVVGRVLAAFDMDVVLCEGCGDIEVDGIVTAHVGDADDCCGEDCCL